MKRFLTLTAIAPIMALIACDRIDTELERAVVGAAIGCAAGQVLVDGRCIEGAIVGAGVVVLSE